MAVSDTHIPFLKTIANFFSMYGLDTPLHPELMCMRLQDQPEKKLLHMPLYRANFFRVILFTNATLHFTSGEHKHSVTDNSLCFTYPGKLESWSRSGRLYGYVIYFTASFAGLDITHNNFDTDYPYFNFNSEMQLLLSVKETVLLKKMAEEMILEMGSDNADKFEMIKKLLAVCLIHIRRIYNKKMNRNSAETKQSKTLYNRFRKTLDDYMQKLASQQQDTMPAVSIIAKQLLVNANYLNSVIKLLTGKPASVHIQEKIMLEAKSYLAHTNLQVAEISSKLGFENPSYFNRFFKKQTGHTPVQFRKNFLK